MKHIDGSIAGFCPKSINLGAVPREGFNGTKIAPTRRNMAHHLCQKSLCRQGNEKELFSRQLFRGLSVEDYSLICDWGSLLHCADFPLLFLLA
jgi:hypothetical protein